MIVGEDTRRRLDPVDRVTGILFGLIMAVTIVGSISIAGAGRDDVRTVLIAALGCNLAWGLVDAAMHLMTTLTERRRSLTLALRVAEATPGAARDIIAESLPAHVAAITGPDDHEAMRRRLLELPRDAGVGLRSDDWRTACALFLVVVAGTFPVVLPFLVFSDVATAMAAARVVTVAMLFAAGAVLGRYAGHARPYATGAVMALFGVVLILLVMALGG